MKKFITILAILLIIVVAFWFIRSEISNGHFSVREFSNKVVYTLSPEGRVADLEFDCQERGGEFNQCGSQCEAGEICAQVCAYTCEFAGTQIGADETQIGAEKPECGIFKKENIQCPPNETCFTHQGSPATCLGDPCSLCGENEACIQLESYPVQIRCIERAGAGGSDEGLAELEEAETILDPPPPPPLSSGEENVITATENIILTSPAPNQELNSPFVTEGEARVFENTVFIQVTNNAGTILIEEEATAHAPDVGQFGPFKISLSYDFSSTKDGWVKVFSRSAASGAVDNLVQVPVEFN